MHTEYRDKGEPFNHVDVIFTGVCAYNFYYDRFSNIIFDIAETAPETIYKDNRAEFLAGEKYNWPGDWGKSQESAFVYF